MSSSTETLIEALRILARDIVSEDGVANAAIAEAADRLAEVEAENGRLRNSLRAIAANSGFGAARQVAELALAGGGA